MKVSSDERGGGAPLAKLARSWQPLSLTKRHLIVAATLAAAASIFLLLLIVPGKSVQAQIASDLWLFLDSGYRLLQGQVPNRDFGTPLGPLTYVLLAAGLGLSGSIGGMVPVATGLFVIALLPLTIYSSQTRLPLGIALLFGIYILILAIAPFFIGDVAPKPTHAMFYNRFGWATLSLLFLFLLPRRGGFGNSGIDAVVMAACVALLFYLKITFAAVAAAFLVGLIWFPHSRRSAIGALLLTAATLLLVELFWGGTANYLSDIRSAARATGAVRDGSVGLAASIINNIHGSYLFAAVLLIAWLRGARWDYLFICFCMGAAGIVLDRHNSQGPGILTYVPGALAALLAPRRGGAAAAFPHMGTAGALLAGALFIPMAASALGNLLFHAWKATHMSTPQYAGTIVDGMIVMEPATSTQTLAKAQGLRAAKRDCGPIEPGLLINPDRPPVETGHDMVVPVVEDAVRLLAANPALGGTVMGFDTAEPFNAILHRPPPRTGVSFVDADITISETVHPKAEDLYGDVDVLLVPKMPWKFGTFRLLEQLYGDYVRQHFVLADRSSCWDAYRRKVPRAVRTAK
ncbi:MAG TPA: hypothetical protein VF662_00165 [Allosphingosinicella sp.]